MAKFIGQTGLVYLWGKIKNYVSNYVKITSSTGKDTITAGNNSIDVYDWAQGSSKPSYTVDELSDGTTYKRFSATEQSKLSNISSGAEVNQNAFSNVKVGNSTIAADAKTDTLEIAVASNSVASLTADTTNDKVTIDVDKDLSKYDNTTSGFITSADVPEGAAASTTTPLMDGTAAKGTDSGFARGDHVHPTDTSRVAANTAITGATKTKITYDSKGLVTGGADLAASDIPSLTLSKISDVTASASELNVLDGITASTAELNIMDGVTASASELNVLDGITATTTELNYVDGVTSAIQTQINAKAPLASPSLTGTPTAPTATAGTNTTQVATTAFVTTAIQNAQTGAAMFQGTAPTTFAPTNYKKGYYWIVGTAGTYCGETCEAGDMIYAVADYNSAYSASDFNVVQRNLDIAEMTTAEMDTATSNWA